MNGFYIFLVWPVWLVGKYLTSHAPQPLPARNLRIAVGFGVLSLVGALAASFAIGPLVPGGTDFVLSSGGALTGLTLFINCLVFATIEEVTKFVPMAIFGRKMLTSVTAGVVYFAFAGLTFGAVESFMYGLQGQDGTLFVRMVLGLFFHAALTGFVGYFYARARLRQGTMAQVYGAFALVSVAHTLYNFGAFMSVSTPAYLMLSMLVSIATNGALFLLYYRAVVADSQQLAAQPPQPVQSIMPVPQPLPPAPITPEMQTPASPPAPEPPVWPDRPIA